jgi:O-antigen/teichoic acid export membrane protein
MENDRFWAVLRTLATGAVAARLVSIISLPAITRLYGPSDFGVLTMLSSVVFLMLPLSSLRYVATIALPKKTTSAIHLVTLCLVFVFLQFILISGTIFFFREAIFNRLGLDEIHKYWWAIPIGFLAGGTYEILSAWALRLKKYKVFSFSQIVQTLLGASTKIVLGLFSLGPIGLVLGFLLTISGGIPSMFRSFRTDFFEYRKNLTIKRFMFLIVYYRYSAFYRLPAQFFVVFSTQIPALFFVFVYGLQVGGQFGLALSVIAVPMGLILNNIGRITYSEAASIGQRKPREVFALMLKLERVGLLLAVPISLCMFFFSNLILPHVFGDEWTLAASFISILAILLPLQFLSNNLVQLLSIHNAQRRIFFFNLRRLIFVIVAFSVSKWLHLSPNNSLWLYVVSLSCHNGFLVYEVRSWFKTKCETDL